jgi:bacterioferritin (cytochrome b1)
MAETHHQPSSLPPHKHRDPLLTKRSKDELMQRQEKYIGETVKSAARESLRQETMVPTALRIGTDGKKKLSELEERLRIEQKVLLNMALAYAYTEAKQRQVSADELRSRIKSMQLDEEYIYFEINEPVLDILFESGTQDAQFIYLNAGLDLLYSRLIQINVLPTIWK